MYVHRLIVLPSPSAPIFTDAGARVRMTGKTPFAEHIPNVRRARIECFGSPPVCVIRVHVFGDAFRYGQRRASHVLGLTVAAALVGSFSASEAAAGDRSLLDRLSGLFSPSRPQEPPAPDAVAYALDIRIAGNDDVESAVEEASNLERLKKSAPSGAAGLIQRALADEERITAALYGEAHYAGTVSIRVAGVAPRDPQAFAAVEAARRSGPVPVEVEVDTGPAFTFGTIRVVDAAGRDLTADLDLDDVDLESGEEARAGRIASGERVILDALRNQGYALARIVDKDVVADHATHKLDVSYAVEPGAPARFGSFTVSGTSGLRPEFIAERIDIRPGEPYSAERLARVRKRLSEYEAVGAVRFREADALAPDGTLPIHVEVSERDPRYIGFGTLYSTTEGLSANTFWGHRNLFGGGETLRLDAQVSWFGEDIEAVPDADPFGYKLAARFTKPGIYTPAEDLVAEAAILREVTNAYVRDAATFLGGVRHRFSDQLSVQVGLDLEQSEVEDTDGYRDDTIVGAPVSLAYDTTDSLLDPSRGVRLNAKVEPFAHLGQSGAGPVLLDASISTYRALDEDNRYILAAKLSSGAILGSDLLDIPPQRRFYVGGGGSLRGFDYQSASPRNADGDIIGGRSYFAASLEARVKLTDTIGIAPFFDMGSAFSSEVPDFGDMRYAAGLGFRYYTGIGPVRLDVAFPLNPGPDDSDYGIYVSVGQAF